MRAILRYLAAMAPYMILSLPPTLLWRQRMSVYFKKRGIKTNTRHETGVLIFSLIVVGILSQTVLSEFTVSFRDFMPRFDISRTNSYGGLNLKLFDVFRLIEIETLRRKNINFFIINFVGNIVLFIPIGFLVCLLWHKPSFLKAFFSGFAFSVFIELCQLPLNRGTDVDDLWLNASGAIIGWTLYVLIRKFCNEPSFKVSKSEIPQISERNDKNDRL